MPLFASPVHAIPFPEVRDNALTPFALARPVALHLVAYERRYRERSLQDRSLVFRRQGQGISRSRSRMHSLTVGARE